MSDDNAKDSQQGSPSGEVPTRPSDGDVIRFKPEKLPGKRRTKPLTIQFEIEVATGKRGEIIAQAQTAAIRNVLNWLATRNPGKDESEGPGTTPPH
jgi:hypothetical protein